MEEHAVTHLHHSSVIARLDLMDGGVKSTLMTVTTTHARMVAALMTSTPSSVIAKLDGLEISVTDLLMNAKAGHAKMEVIVKSNPVVTDVDVQWAQKVKTVNTTSMSASPTLASMETAQMASTGTSAAAILDTQEETVKLKLTNAQAHPVSMGDPVWTLLLASSVTAQEDTMAQLVPLM